MNFLDIDVLNEIAEKNHDNYVNADPFPHIVLKGLFNDDDLKECADEFATMRPRMTAKNANNTVQKYSFNRVENAYEKFEPKTQQIVDDLNSKEFLQFLEKLTGIDDLENDPMFEGGGPHEILTGGFLKMHVDFNLHHFTKQQRKLNLLLYLNDDWKASWGGELELWDTEFKDMSKSIKPNINTMVIFSTTDNSWHGHPDPLNCPQGKSRKSLALYYYNPPSDKKIKAHTTIYKKRMFKD